MYVKCKLTGNLICVFMKYSAIYALWSVITFAGQIVTVRKRSTSYFSFQTQFIPLVKAQQFFHGKTALPTITESEVIKYTQNTQIVVCYWNYKFFFINPYQSYTRLHIVLY